MLHDDHLKGHWLLHVDWMIHIHWIRLIDMNCDWLGDMNHVDVLVKALDGYLDWIRHRTLNSVRDLLFYVNGNFFLHHYGDGLLHGHRIGNVDRNGDVLLNVNRIGHMLGDGTNADDLLLLFPSMLMLLLVLLVLMVVVLVVVLWLLVIVGLILFMVLLVVLVLLLLLVLRLV